MYSHRQLGEKKEKKFFPQIASQSIISHCTPQAAAESESLDSTPRRLQARREARRRQIIIIKTRQARRAGEVRRRRRTCCCYCCFTADPRYCPDVLSPKATILLRHLFGRRQGTRLSSIDSKVPRDKSSTLVCAKISERAPPLAHSRLSILSRNRDP